MILFVIFQRIVSQLGKGHEALSFTAVLWKTQMERLW